MYYLNLVKIYLLVIILQETLPKAAALRATN